MERDHTLPCHPEEEEEIKVIVEIFVTGYSTLCLTLPVKPSCTIKWLIYKTSCQMYEYQEHDAFPYYNRIDVACFPRNRLLQDDSTLNECNISNMDRVSVFPNRDLELKMIIQPGPEYWPIHFPFNINCLDSVGLLKKKIFDLRKIPPHKQLLSCGGRWLLDDDSHLLDAGFAPRIVYHENYLDMTLFQVIVYRQHWLENIEFDITIKVPQYNLQFCLIVHLIDTINHVKSMILQKSPISEEKHMLIFRDKNLLENGQSVLLDHVIEKNEELILCEKGSFLIWVARKGSGQRFTIEVESLDTVDFLKKKIQAVTNIALEDLCLFYEGDKGPMVMYEGCLVRYGIVKLSNPKVPELMISYSDDDERLKIFLSRKCKDKEVPAPRVPLSFWDKVGDSVSADVPAKDFLMQLNSQSNPEASFKIFIFIPLSECLNFHTSFTVGPNDTMESVKTKIKECAKIHKEVDDLAYIQEGEYVLLLNKQQLPEDVSSTVQQCGISDEDQILLCPKASFSIRACLPSRCLTTSDDEKTSTANDINEKNVIVNCLDTVSMMKDKISVHSEFPLKSMELFFNGSSLSDEKLLVEYGIVSHPVASVNRRWMSRVIELKVIPSYAM